MTEQVHDDDLRLLRTKESSPEASDPALARALTPPPGRVGNQAAGRLLGAQDAGVPPPAAVRARMQARLGEDLAGVRVHTGAYAARAAASVEAVAYTSGEHIVLGTDAPAPGTDAGDRLLAHELTHVAQQRRAGTVLDGVSDPSNAGELAAESIGGGHQGASGISAVHARGSVHGIQRQTVIGKERRAYKREEVQQLLEQYLEGVLQTQGRRTLEKTPQVISAISSLFRDNPVLQGSVELWLKGITDGTPAGLARDVARKLPDVVPEDRLDKIRGVQKKPSESTEPTNAADAAGSVVVDSTVAPIVRKLPLSKEKQDQIIGAARSAVADGAMGVLDAVLDAVGVGGADKSALHAAVEGLIKQQPGKAPDRQQDGPGSPYRKEPPPSMAPPNAAAPGERVFTSPKIPWDFPGTKAPPKPAAPVPKFDPAVEKAARAVDPRALVPAEVVGTPRADNFDFSAVDFALDVSRRLDAAHNQGNARLLIELGQQYAGIKDRADVLQRAKAIVLAMRDALPHHAAKVLRVSFTVGGNVAFSFPLQ